jgi:hypothetical protein
MKDFIPHLSHLLENYLPESDSLGLRVKTLIKQDVIKIIDQLKAMDAGNTNSRLFEINKQIINASSLYITKLEEIAYALNQNL